MTHIVPFEEKMTYARAIAASGLFGINRPEEAIALMGICEAEGLHPAIAARDYHIIQGRPTLKADAMLARFQQAGGSVKWTEYNDDVVTGVFAHPQGGELTLSWTMERAKQIGLARNPTWGKYPRAMLRARCISEGIRTVYPGCVVGVYTPEEVESFDTAEVEVVETTPSTITKEQAKELVALVPHGTEDGHPEQALVTRALKHFGIARCLELPQDKFDLMKQYLTKHLEKINEADNETDD